VEPDDPSPDPATEPVPDPSPDPTTERPTGPAWGPAAHGDDLDGYETSMARFARRFKGWLAAIVAVALIVPAGGWLVDELLFQRSAGQVEADVASGVVDAVLLVRAVSCDGQVSTGSAFVVELDGQPRMVTNRHVVAGARTVSVRGLEGGPSRRVASHALATGADVAVLEATDPASLPAPLVLGPPAEVGQDVRLVGFPAALPFTTAGTVEDVAPRRLMLDLRTDPGASGSPVVDSEDRVVGQIFARTDDGRGVATSANALARAIATAEPAPAC
jgi:S1-C subfamily serine protease